MKNIRTFALAGISVLTLCNPAFAQDAGADNGEGVSDTEIVVSARRRDEALQDVPLVVNAVTAETIGKLNLRKFEDITQVVPGLQMKNNGNAIGTVSSIRGVNYDVNVSGNNGTIEYYFNDASISAGILFNGMYDIGQIEVLRGPQGTLRGRASPSGSITVTARRPDLEQAGGYVSGTANDIHGRNLNGAINVPIIADILGIRIAGLLENNQGNRVHSLLSAIDPYDETRSGRVSVRFEPFDFLSLNGTYARIDRQTAQFGQVESFANLVPGTPDTIRHIDPRDRLSYLKSPTRNHQQFEIWNWQAQVRYAGQRLIYVGSKTSQDTLSIGADSDFANVIPTVSITGSTRALSGGRTHEVRLQNEDRVAGMLDYVVGYFYDAQNGSPPNSGTTLSSNTIILNPVTRAVTLIQTPIRQGQDTRENSFFANLNFHLGDRAEISGGARHIKFSSVNLLTINNVANPLANYSDSFKHWIFNFSAKYRFSPELMVYASYGTSWRPGSVAVGDFSVNQSQREFEFTHQSPETSKTIEVGFKADLLDHRARLNVSAYQQDFTNYPFHANSTIYYLTYSAASPNPTVATGSGAGFNFVSESKVRARGVEAEASFQVTPQFNIGGNINYALGRIKNGLLPCNDLNGDGVADVLSAAPTVGQLRAIPNYETNHFAVCRGSPRSSFSPVWSGVGHFDFNLPLDDVAGGSEAFARGLFSWYGRTVNDPNNAFDDIGSYGTLNGYLGLRSQDGKWEISAYGKNLLNKLAVLSRGTAPQNTTTIGAGVFNSQYVGISVNEPREFGITIRAAFGSR
jgi:iron complex outermembrane receptor protein